MSSPLLDRGTELSRFAAAGIREAPVVDLTNEAVETYRESEGTADAGQQKLAAGSISPLALPDLALDIHDVLPPGA